MLAALGAANFLTTLPSSGVAAILPVIQVDLGVDVVTASLALVVYQIVGGSLLLLFGRLGDLRGYRPLLLAGLAIYIAGSAIGGLSLSITPLVAARGVQGLGAAMLFPASTAILIATFPANERGRGLGILAVVTYVGLSMGPVLAGWLTDLSSWHAVFLVNVPLGIALFAFIWRVIPAHAPPSRGESFDVLGAVSFALGLSAILLVLQEGGSWGWFSLPALLLGAFALITTAAFVAIETRHRHPALDLGLFREPAFSAAILSAIVNYVAFTAVQVLLPFYLIHGRSLTPALAGLLLSAQPLGQVVASPVSGLLADRIGPRPPALGGMALLAVGLALLSRLDAVSSLVIVVVALAIIGLGSGMFVTPNTASLMFAAPRSRQGTAAAASVIARYVGFASGTALASASLVASVGSADGFAASLHTGLSIAAVLAIAGAFTVSLGSARTHPDGPRI